MLPCSTVEGHPSQVNCVQAIEKQKSEGASWFNHPSGTLVSAKITLMVTQHALNLEKGLFQQISGNEIPLDPLS